MKDAREKERTVPPLALITPDKNQYMSSMAGSVEEKV